MLAAALLPLPATAQPCADAWQVTSVEGTVEVRRSGQANWMPIARGDFLCVGDSLRVGAYSRAAVLTPDDTQARIDQNTTVSFIPPRDQKRSWIEVLGGALHFISRDPNALGVLTPFANAGIEGTEFLVVVTNEETTVTVFEGEVAVSTADSEVSAASGQQVSARPGQALVAQTVVRPRDAVQWTLHYVPVLDQELPEADATPSSQEANDPSFFTGRAARRLSVGRVEEAGADLDQALSFDANNVDALALQSIVALTQNDKDEALRLATRAVEQDSQSAAALIAMSYAQQAFFDISGALATLESAVEYEPANALAWARLSELWLSVGDLDQGLSAAQMAASLNPDVERTQTVLGFAYLTRVDIQRAMEAFERAIALDESAPLPRLGLGLALIRDGQLVAGRERIETAVILDPGDALIRSYMGKAYYEEKRDELAESQYAIAKELDPLDPTAWFYDAIRKQTLNRPVEALKDVQQSIELNDNRAVYRSRELLDEDLGARSAGLGRIYRDLGFERLASLEGLKTVTADPGNHSGHRLLADIYSTQPRHEFARVNELFQSQVLQNLSLTPIQTQLGDTNPLILDSAGPADVAFNEFNPLFTRNRLAFQASGVVGGNETQGEDIAVAGIANRLSYSFGQFHFETDGFRENNDFEQDALSAFVQFRPSEKNSFLAELRSTERDQGDRALRFDPVNYDSGRRYTEDIDSLRLGMNHVLSPESTLLGSLSFVNGDFQISSPISDVDLGVDVEGYSLDLQSLQRIDRWHVTSGLRYTERDQVRVNTVTFPFPFTDVSPFTTEFASGYVYARLNRPQALSFTLGASVDSLDGESLSEDVVNPKIGILWEPHEGTTVRVAAFETIQPPRYSAYDHQAGLEPSQVAGFNQVFLSLEGEQSRRYGVALDHEFSLALYAGFEFQKADNNMPFVFVGPPDITYRVDVEENIRRAYVYWTPLATLALSAEYHYEDKANEEQFPLPEGITKLRTHRVPLAITYSHPRNWSMGLTGTYVDQTGDFILFVPPFFVTGEDQFWVTDAFFKYRLPNRHGTISVDVHNIFDEDFQFQDVDPENSSIAPERLALLKFTLSF